MRMYKTIKQFIQTIYGRIILFCQGMEKNKAGKLHVYADWPAVSPGSWTPPCGHSPQPGHVTSLPAGVSSPGWTCHTWNPTLGAGTPSENMERTLDLALTAGHILNVELYPASCRWDHQHFLVWIRQLSTVKDCIVVLMDKLYQIHYERSKHFWFQDTLSVMHFLLACFCVSYGFQKCMHTYKHVNFLYLINISDGVTLNLRQKAVIEMNDTWYWGQITENKLQTHLRL